MRSQGSTRTWHPTGLLVISLISVFVFSFLRSFGLAWFDPYVPQNLPHSLHDAVHGFTAPSQVTAKLVIPAKLVFLKTHKTGSSTLSGILWRELCERRGLHCFLPPEANPGRTWNFATARDREYAKRNAGTDGRGAPFDVWLHHARRTDNLFSEVMNMTQITEPGIRFISIVRSPDNRFRSAWTWYMHRRMFGGMSLQRFAYLMSAGADGNLRQSGSSSDGTGISSWLDYFAAPVVRLIASSFLKYRTGLDSTAEELVGLSPSDAAFPDKFRALLEDVAAGRVLLLVCDRFEESLLVLNALIRTPLLAGKEEGHTVASAHSTALPFRQLAYLRQKQQGNLEVMSERTAARLRRLQPHDTALYNAANTMLDRYITALYGGNMTHFHSELHALRRENEELQKACAPADSAALTPALAVECELLRRDNKDLVQAAWRSIKKSS